MSKQDASTADELLERALGFRLPTAIQQASLNIQALTKLPSLDRRPMSCSSNQSMLLVLILISISALIQILILILISISISISVPISILISLSILEVSSFRFNLNINSPARSLTRLLDQIASQSALCSFFHTLYGVKILLPL